MKLDFRSLYLDRTGRVDRATFWLAGLILIAIYTVVTTIVGLLSTALIGLAQQQSVQIAAYILSVLVFLIFIYLSYCLLVKRGNDQGQPSLISQGFVGLVAVIYLAPKLIILLSSTPDVAKATLQSYNGVFLLGNLLLAAIAAYVLYEFGLREGKK
jgi:uncharacterized membrane protein YhaH (DUF805 family)